MNDDGRRQEENNTDTDPSIRFAHPLFNTAKPQSFNCTLTATSDHTAPAAHYARTLQSLSLLVFTFVPSVDGETPVMETFFRDDSAHWDLFNGVWHICSLYVLISFLFCVKFQLKQYIRSSTKLDLMTTNYVQGDWQQFVSHFTLTLTKTTVPLYRLK